MSGGGLEPCPFCESRLVRPNSWVDAEEMEECWAIWCENCFAYGPQAGGESGAAVLWNDRARTVSL